MLDDSKIFDAILNSREVADSLAKELSVTPDFLSDYLKSKKASNVASQKSSVSAGKAVFHVDGGSRGNPGVAGSGVYMEAGGSTIGYYYYLGVKTNNFAEYVALNKALTIAGEAGYKDVEVYTDSELVCKQVKGEYKVKNEQLKELFNAVVYKAQAFEKFNIVHVRREYNKEADALANKAMDEKRDGKVEYTVAG